MGQGYDGVLHTSPISHLSSPLSPSLRSSSDESGSLAVACGMGIAVLAWGLRRLREVRKRGREGGAWTQRIEEQRLFKVQGDPHDVGHVMVPFGDPQVCAQASGCLGPSNIHAYDFIRRSDERRAVEWLTPA